MTQAPYPARPSGAASKPVAASTKGVLRVAIYNAYLLQITLKDGRSFEVPLDEAEAFARNTLDLLALNEASRRLAQAGGAPS